MRILALIAFVFTTACLYSQEAVFFVRKPNMKFPRTIEGEVIEHTYMVENHGDAPLLISSYEVECSCTTISFPSKEIVPGTKMPLTMRFDTDGKHGYQDRVILLRTNTKKGVEELRFEVNVRSIK
jgi:hypothetical protein